MNGSERTIVSVSFVQGFRAAYYDEERHEIFYQGIDGFALTKGSKCFGEEKSLEPFVIQDDCFDYTGRLSYRGESLGFPHDCTNFLGIVRGSDFLSYDSHSVKRFQEKIREERAARARAERYEAIYGHAPPIDLPDSWGGES